MNTERNFTAEEYAELPLHTAMILRDHVRDNKTYREIATANDIPIGTVRSRIHRARAKIAAMRAAAAPAEQAVA